MKAHIRSCIAVSCIVLRLQSTRTKATTLFLPTNFLFGTKEDGAADQNPTRRRNTIEGNVTVPGIHYMNTVMSLLSGAEM